MRAVFVDTGAWVALRYKRDGHHVRAQANLKRIVRERFELVTSALVLAETVTLLKARGAIDHALALGEAIRAGKLGTLVDLSGPQQRRAWELFRRYRDLPVGYVDCTSFAVMEDMGVRVAFGFDRDFVAAGFELFPGA
ncbi:MAG: type II toxin-antitoxin system VapC family toxin [Polyangiaceae bacterium]